MAKSKDIDEKKFVENMNSLKNNLQNKKEELVNILSETVKN